MKSFSTLNDIEKKELWAGLALLHTPGLGARKRKRLLAHFGSAYAALQTAHLWEAAKVENKLGKLCLAGVWRDAAKDIWQRITDCPCGILLWTDPLYPPLLRELIDSPVMLFYRGNIQLLQVPAIAVVGARECSAKGMEIAIRISRGLSHAGITVVSGMARGIDRVAHLAGIEAIGRSIGVVGTGPDIVYPRGNSDVWHILHKKGLLLTEFPPGTVANPRNFPIRNRIIAGLTYGVLVVEAEGKSGSLITARLALEQNREVFAIPSGGGLPSSQGCVQLLEAGATEVVSAEQILHELAPLLLKKRVRDTARYAAVPLDLHEMLHEEEAIGLCNSYGIPWLAPKAQLHESSLVATPVAGSSPILSDGQQTEQPTEQPTGQRLPNAAVLADCAGCAVPELPCCLVEPILSSDFVIPATVGAEEHSILEILLEESQVHVNELALRLDQQVAQVSGFLAMLEVQGLVKRLPGMFYVVQR